MKRMVGVLTVLMGFAAIDALAHHSPAVFDRSRQITIAGTVTEFRWSNPHSWIHLQVTEGDGAGLWSVEMNPASQIARNGWTSKTLKPGDRVEVRVYPLRNNEKGGQYISLKLPDGTIMDEHTRALEVQPPQR
jgi:Family of unknown function (DUF6152)